MVNFPIIPSGFILRAENKLMKKLQKRLRNYQVVQSILLTERYTSSPSETLAEMLRQVRAYFQWKGLLPDAHLFSEIRSLLVGIVFINYYYRIQLEENLPGLARSAWYFLCREEYLYARKVMNYLELNEETLMELYAFPF